MNKSIYSLVLSDEVVEAVDALARAANVSRSAMINRILAERVAYITPEMRLQEILDSLERSMNGAFMLSAKPAGGVLSARTSLKYRYKPTVKYSVEMYSQNGKRAGEMKVTFRTQNAQLIDDLTGFFRCWTRLEQKFAANRLGKIVYRISDGKFTRMLNMPDERVSDDEVGAAVADYMAAFDGTMKEYFARLPDIEEGERAAEAFYREIISDWKVII